METNYVRRLSPVERLWLAADRLCPPFVHALVFEGEGELDPDRWREAVARAAAACPGVRVALRGHLWRSRWVDTGAAPPVREVDASGWSGRGSDGADFLLAPLDPRRGPTCEWLLLQGDPPRALFRSLHAVMDGMGSLTFVRDVFRCLRGEEAQGADSALTELELMRSVRDEWAPIFPRECGSPMGAPEGAEPGVIWTRRRIACEGSRLVPRVMRVLAEETHHHGGGIARFGMPVDLRRHRPGVRSTGNLTGAVHLVVVPGDTAQDIQKELRTQLAEEREAVRIGRVEVLPFVPLRVMHRRGREAVRQTQATGRFASTATISTLGRFDLGQYSCGGFEARTVFAVPCSTETHPLLMALLGSGGHVEATAAAPRTLASNGRLEALMDRVAEDLEG